MSVNDFTPLLFGNVTLPKTKPMILDVSKFFMMRPVRRPGNGSYSIPEITRK